MPPAARKHQKGMSPKLVRRAHVSRSTESDAPMFCKTSKGKYDTMSPDSKRFVRDDTDNKLAILKAEAAEEEVSAKRKLFGIAGSSTAPGSPSSPKKKKKNNKDEPVSPYAPSPPGALSPTNPGRDGSDKVKRILACSPETKFKQAD